ncbi:MAG: PBP1A family penicillin-binding protein [Lachnospiraceae bacterium]|nr:PBP1A family penicillin-binding protein [Lachnospiraceae bacterium]
MKRAGRVRRIPIWVIITLILVVILAGISGLIVGIAVRAPKIGVLDAVPKGYRSSILDDEGNVVLTLSGESSNRVYVKLTEIPEDLQHAFVAIEDERFYTHHGVDPRGIARAVFKGIRSGGITEGASTITQQLLKNNVFTEWTKEQSFAAKVERKLEEQYLAIVLEQRASKDWILENYLNTINLGGGNWGVETAARYYFDKDVSDLTLSESAVLAGITKNPTTYNPLKNPEENKERRILVLKKMLSLGYITEQEMEEALTDPVYERIGEVSRTVRTQEIMTYFEDSLVYDLIQDLMEANRCTEDEAWNLLYRGGLTVYSTENSRLQEICEGAAGDDSLYPDGSEISMVMIDNRNGQVKAMIGGRGKKEASLLFNRAIASKRQPGSTIKVIGEYAAALEKSQITLGTIVDDAPYTYSDGTSVVNSNGVYAGKTTVRSAIVHSNNIVALKVFQNAGMDTVWTQLQRFGISTLTDADKVEALALGGTSGGVTNLELTAAYSAIARGGEYLEPVYYTKVLDREGNVLLENRQRSVQAVRESTAELLTDALQDVMTQGTGTTADFEGMPMAGKSGTSTGIRDAWFEGYTPYYTFGIWGGYDDNQEQESSKYVQNVWKTVMTKAHEGLAETALNNAEDKHMCYICTKCGKLAVEGLCDVSEQGDMTAKEYFIPGTEPTEKCTCHVAVRICSESGEKASTHCTSTYTKVFLKEATADTEDAAYVIPESLAGDATCQTHRHFWSGWFHSGEKKEDPAEETEEPVPIEEPEEDPEEEVPYGEPEEDLEEEPDEPEEKEEDEGGGFWGWLFG